MFSHTVTEYFDPMPTNILSTDTIEELRHDINLERLNDFKKHIDHFIVANKALELHLPEVQYFPIGNPFVDKFFLFLAWSSKSHVEALLKGLPEQEKLLLSELVNAFKDAHKHDILSSLFKTIKNKIHNLKEERATQGDNKTITDEILDLLDSARLEKIDRAKMLDLIITLNSIYKILVNHTDETEIKNAITAFFATRDTLLAGDSLDYCATRSAANYLCAKIAVLLFPTVSPLTTLLNQSAKANRLIPWSNLLTLETDLPENPGEVFRSSDGRIQHYQTILERAIINIKNGETRKEKVFMGSDLEEDIDQRLNQDDLSVLRQRASTFKELIDYIERLEKYEHKNETIYQQFEKLLNIYRPEIFSYDVREAYMDKAYIGIANFAEWWNDIKKSDNGEDLQNQIMNVDEKLSKFIKTILDPKGCDNSVYIMHHLLTEIIHKNEVRRSLMELEKQLSWRVGQQTLDKWSDKINSELNSRCKAITTDKNVCNSLLNDADFMKQLPSDPEIDYSNVISFLSRKTQANNQRLFSNETKSATAGSLSPQAKHPFFKAASLSESSADEDITSTKEKTNSAFSQETNNAKGMRKS